MKIIKKYNNYLKDVIKDLEWENALIHVDNINEVTRKFYISGSSILKNRKPKEKLSKKLNKEEMKRKNDKIEKQQSNSIENLTNCLDSKNEKDTSNKRLGKRIQKVNKTYNFNRIKKTTTDTGSKRQRNLSCNEKTSDSDNEESSHQTSKNSKKSKKIVLGEKNENKPSDIESNKEIISENKSSLNEEQSVKHPINKEIDNVTTIEITEKEEDEVNINHTKKLTVPEEIHH